MDVSSQGDHHRQGGQILQQHQHHQHHQQSFHRLPGAHSPVSPLTGLEDSKSPEPRKKTDRFSKKSSQACDNCRKRKVRCDAGEVLEARGRCSICEIQELECTFEHVPRQRGPPRGFKKLKRQRTDEALALPASEPSFVGDGGPDDPRRDVDEDDGGDLYGRTHPLGPRTRRGRSSGIGDTAARVHHDDDDDDDDDGGLHGQSQEMTELDGLPWIQHAIDRWYILYQPTFPILDDDARFQGLNPEIHPLLRTTLILAIYSIVYRSRTREKTDAALATELLAQYNLTVKGRGDGSVLNRLTHLQVTMILAIEADQRGYEVARSIHTVGYWLGQAVGQAYDMKLHWAEADVSSGSGELHLGRRLFLILIVLDRWHSVSTSTPPLVADANAKFDHRLPFSGITNHLYRLSLVVGAVYETIMARTSGARGGLASCCNVEARGEAREATARLKAEIENWRERVDVIWGQSNLLHVAYWHLCTLSLLDTSPEDGDGIVALREMALRMSSTLPNSATPYTPLNHHFYNLTTCVLAHLLGFEGTRRDAAKGLQDLREAIERHKELIAEDDASWDSKLLEVIGALQRGEGASGQGPRARGDRSLLCSIRRRGYLLCIDEAVPER